MTPDGIGVGFDGFGVATCYPQAPSQHPNVRGLLNKSRVSSLEKTMAQEWRQTLQAAMDLVLRGDAEAVGTVRSELQAHPVLGPFAVLELCRQLFVTRTRKGDGNTATSPRCNPGDVARVLEIVLLAALDSRKTQQALLATLLQHHVDDSNAAATALREGMRVVDWRVKMAVAAQFVSRRHVLSSSHDTPTEAGDGPRMMGMVAEMVESAVSCAQVAHDNNAKEAGARQELGAEPAQAPAQEQEYHHHPVPHAATVLYAQSEALNLSPTCRAVLQLLCLWRDKPCEAKHASTLSAENLRCSVLATPLAILPSVSAGTVDEALVEQQHLVRLHLDRTTSHRRSPSNSPAPSHPPIPHSSSQSGGGAASQGSSGYERSAKKQRVASAMCARTNMLPCNAPQPKEGGGLRLSRILQQLYGGGTLDLQHPFSTAGAQNGITLGALGIGGARHGGENDGDAASWQQTGEQHACQLLQHLERTHSWTMTQLVISFVVAIGGLSTRLKGRREIARPAPTCLSRPSHACQLPRVFARLFQDRQDAVFEARRCRRAADHQVAGDASRHALTSLVLAIQDLQQAPCLHHMHHVPCPHTSTEDGAQRQVGGRCVDGLCVAFQLLTQVQPPQTNTFCQLLLSRLHLKVKNICVCMPQVMEAEVAPGMALEARAGMFQGGLEQTSGNTKTQTQTTLPSTTSLSHMLQSLNIIFTEPGAEGLGEERRVDAATCNGIRCAIIGLCSLPLLLASLAASTRPKHIHPRTHTK